MCFALSVDQSAAASNISIVLSLLGKEVFPTISITVQNLESVGALDADAIIEMRRPAVASSAIIVTEGVPVNDSSAFSSIYLGVLILMACELVCGGIERRVDPLSRAHQDPHLLLALHLGNLARRQAGLRGRWRRKELLKGTDKL